VRVFYSIHPIRRLDGRQEPGLDFVRLVPQGGQIVRRAGQPDLAQQQAQKRRQGGIGGLGGGQVFHQLVDLLHVLVQAGIQSFVFVFRVCRHIVSVSTPWARPRAFPYP